MRPAAAHVVLCAAIFTVTFQAQAVAQAQVQIQAPVPPRAIRVPAQAREIQLDVEVIVVEHDGLAMMLLNVDASDRRAQLSKIAEAVATSVRKSMMTTLNREMEAISLSVTDAQKRKLRLAGEGDITRVLRKIEEVDLLRSDTEVGLQQYHDVALALQRIELLGNSFAFDEQSLFQKAMRKTLSDEQVKSIRRAQQAVVVAKALQIVGFTDKPFELTDEQRRQVTEILLDGANPPSQLGNYGHYVVLYHAAKLEDPLKRVLNPNQWEVFQDRISFARRAVPDLRRKGLLPEFQDDTAPADGTIR